MERHLQKSSDLLKQLGAVKTDWKDELTINFIEFLTEVQQTKSLSKESIKLLLDKNFDLSMLLFRLVLEQSKDEFNITLKSLFSNSKEGFGKKAFKKNPDKFAEKMVELGLVEQYQSVLEGTFTWKDIVLERLKGGRGSAIKGQTRGRNLEDFVELYVRTAFLNYEAKVSFIGRDGSKKAKADFCIPSRDQPGVIIEVKAYGATGSKQSDVIGDIEKIIKEKRNDTQFLLVTDGVTWVSRMSDFEKLVKFQNEGHIYRIYTQKMFQELSDDLMQLKTELRF